MPFTPGMSPKELLPAGSPGGVSSPAAPLAGTGGQQPFPKKKKMAFGKKHPELAHRHPTTDLAHTDPDDV